jgi:hypothetical protein
MEFSYKSGDDYVFVNPETFEEVTVTPELVGEAKNYLVENASVTDDLRGRQGGPGGNPRQRRSSTVTDAPEGIRGDSANNVQKAITLRDRPRGAGPAVHQDRREDQGGYPHRQVHGTRLIRTGPVLCWF